MKKLRICMISSEFPPHSAGIGNVVYHLAKALIEKGHKVVVITRGNWKGSKIRLIEGIKVYELPFIPFFPPFHIIFHGYFVNKLLKELSKDFDIIHLHSPLIPVIDTDLPVITMVHSTWNFEAKTFNKIVDWYSLAVKLFRKIFIIYENKVFLKSNLFIAISGALAEELQNFYKVDPSKIHVVRNSIDISNYKYIQKNNDKDNLFNILTIGRLVYRKGVLDLIEAAKIVYQTNPKIIFSLIGKGPLEKTIRNKVKKYHLENNVFLLGQIPNTLIKDYLKKASVFMIPSHYEGLPLVLLEAIASGKPIVGTDIKGVREVITNNKNGLLVQSQNPQELANAVIKLSKNSTLREYLAKNAKKTAKLYDRNLMINKILDIYENLLNNFQNYPKQPIVHNVLAKIFVRFKLNFMEATNEIK